MSKKATLFESREETDKSRYVRGLPGNVCGKLSPKYGFACCRRRGHKGVHEAHLLDATQTCARWEAGASVSRSENNDKTEKVIVKGELEDVSERVFDEKKRSMLQKIFEIKLVQDESKDTITESFGISAEDSERFVEYIEAVHMAANKRCEEKSKNHKGATASLIFGSMLELIPGSEKSGKELFLIMLGYAVGKSVANPLAALFSILG